ncbi:YcdB/YcdC domain-containing protein [Effusibacillus dendaii]|uniref:SLH domain-containing protein n=1 Tax=Effusibacillus dendaii TaxID=2743772 RepID=A0A7I8DC10_9BACL|nr:YcdB/YcdC domain-containing protein [Effusibacillus dendaii]BCJ87635.1 hypothetical protein skT53_26200 [Effusibacillus dendaii]
MGNRKRVAVLSLVSGLLLASVPYAALAAEPTVAAVTVLTQEQAVEKLKQMLAIPDGYELKNASLYEDKGNGVASVPRSAWRINYGPVNSFDRGNITAAIDAKTGVLLDANIFSQDDEQIVSPISRDQAGVIAKKYLEQFAPDKSGQVQEQPMEAQYKGKQPYGSQMMHQFRFVRMVNAGNAGQVAYPNDSITITVNGKGELRAYYRNWSDEVQFPAVDRPLPMQEAGKKFETALNLHLQYIPKRTPYQKSIDEAYLVYSPVGPSFAPASLPVIDAVSGGVLGPDGNPVTDSPKAEYKPLTDQPGTAKAAGPISKEKALQLLADYHLALDGYTLQNSSYENNENSAPVWRFSYQKGNPQDYLTIKNVNVTINAATGELMEYYIYQADQKAPEGFPKDPAVSKDKAVERAVDFVKNAVPTLTNRVAFTSASSSADRPEYYVQFVQLVNGIPFQDLSFNVTVDANTGEIRNFNIGWGWNEKIRFPSPQPAIDLASAAAKYMEKSRLQLQFIPVYEHANTPFKSGVPPYAPGNSPKIKLVYAPFGLEGSQSVNAITGEWVSVWGEPVPQQAEAEDIKGNWAEKELQYFLNRGIFKTVDGKLKPDDPVTRGDMIKYMILATDRPLMAGAQKSAAMQDVPQTDPNFDYIREAYFRKWIDQKTDNFRPDDIITREELADLATAVLGYGKLSDATGIFQNPYQDVSVSEDGKYVGDIAIVSGLHILTGSDGLFHPKDPVTKAQAAVVMMRVLEQMPNRGPVNY